MRWTFKFKKFQIGIDESQILAPTATEPGTHARNVIVGGAGHPWLLYKMGNGDYGYINISLCYQITEHR